MANDSKETQPSLDTVILAINAVNGTIKSANENMQKETVAIGARISEMYDKFIKTMGAMEIRISAIEEKIQKLETQEKEPEDEQGNNAILSIKKDLEAVKIQARSKNLIFHGVSEEAGETRAALKETITKILNHHYKQPSVLFDLPTRLGAASPKTTKNRPVIVTFALQSDRDSILYRRTPGCPVSVKEDVPPEVAAKRRILGRLTKWAKDNTKKYKRTNEYVEIEGVRYNPEEAQDFLDAHDDNRTYPRDEGNNTGFLKNYTNKKSYEGRRGSKKLRKT